MSSLRKIFVAVLSGATILSLSGVGQAEPAGRAPKPPVSSETLAQGTTSAPFTITAETDRTMWYRRAVLRPGATTGWHYHVGEEIAVVKSGVLTRFDATCTAKVYRAGDALVEPVGPDTVHIGANLGTEPVELYVVDVLPTDATAPTVPVPDPGCPLPR
ncbi:cupin domain-containing protein [Gandjariella thermophila]|uniref:Cupin type-2 domain-containing protein n=1 Tax=Gandjariella thermophila TaxID=1931992 RepID=A0A4D4JFG7_9PSEU|nr:cupin domain-containing protein [Gandjariella thermophila]GDY33146.1 hypothetical protein GTS_47790 [Gandjariella thermophila]